jgi:hypothetical protein
VRHIVRISDVLYELAMRRSPAPLGGATHVARLALLQVSVVFVCEVQ